MSALYRKYRKDRLVRFSAGAVGFLLLLVAVSLSGCQMAKTGPLAEGATGVTFKVGENAVGESCKVIGVEPLVESEEIRAVYNVFCGRWTEPSARIFRSAQPIAATEMLSGGWWRGRLSDFANCSSPEPRIILGEVPASFMDCSLRVGGWPYPALAVELDGSTYAAEAIPAALAVAERTIGILAGKMSPAQAQKSGKIARQVSELETSLVAAQYSVGDLNTFRDLLHLGKKYNLLAKYSDAEQAYRQALALHEKILPDQKDGLSYLYMQIALELSNQGHFSTADALFEKADQLLIHSMEPTYESTLVSYRALGSWILPAAGADITEEEVGHAVDGNVLFASVATAGVDVVQSRYLEAAMLQTKGETEEAEKVLTEALSILETNPQAPRDWYYEILLLRGEIAEQQGELNRAAKLLQESLVTQQKLYRGSRTEALTYIALGRVYAAQDDSSQAYSAFSKGFSILRELGENIPVDKAMPYLQLGLEVSRNLPEREQEIYQELFENGQLVSGALVAQLMRQTSARLASGDQKISKIIRELQDARSTRDELQDALDTAHSDPAALSVNLAEMELQLENTTKQIGTLERAVQAAEPRYNQLLETPVAAQDVFDLLQPGEALSQILVGSSGSFGFFVDNKGVTAYEIDLTADQASGFVGALRRPMEELDPETGLPLHFPVAEAHTLFQKLFAPVSEQLTESRHLITVPSGPLLSLPFNVLVLQPHPQKIKKYDYSSVDWMGGHFALTLAPTVQSLVNLRKTVSASNASLPFIGFGDFTPIGADPGPILDTFGQSPRCLDTAKKIAGLPPLHETADELQAVAKLLNAPEDSLILDKAFSKKTISDTNLKDYHVVYFATHGLLPHQLECLQEPALVVSSPDSGYGDILLTSNEILDLKMDADLVVLSACNTGGPEGGATGEALSGLARVFFFAGARSMLVTHGEIPSDPTVKLMQDTFGELTSKNLSMAEALLNSQKAMIAYPPWSHPIAWAGFSIVGDGSQRLTVNENAPKVAAGGE